MRVQFINNFLDCIDDDQRFGQIMRALFVSADLHNQKLKEIPDNRINWPNSYISALIGRKICMFDVEFDDLMGRPNVTFSSNERL
jgi:hypothetical protein